MPSRARRTSSRAWCWGAVEAALASATKKLLGGEADVRVQIDPDTGAYETFRRWKVVPDEAGLQNPEAEELYSDVVDEYPGIQVGDFIEKPIESVPLGPHRCADGQADHPAEDPRR